MEWLVWIGAMVSVLGLVGIVLSVVLVIRARRAELDDDALRAKLNRVLPLNLGALFLSVIGLMMVVLGVLLT
ncbi:hypothetical protein AB3Y40_09670 [Yoonia sp. R2331]|uniref:hypothetical protein n=1 Tax=Yoonia sp. R2331 TaxID=3237238 RepID=UPI0034E5E712